MSKRLRILVVEDNAADVDLIREYMSDSGFISFQIDSVPRLSEAIVRLEGESFDLLLIDLGLPDSRGLETFYKLRKAAPNTPAIILTGQDDEGTAMKAVRNGAQDYLIKGEIIGNTLVRAAQYAVERKRAETELRERESKLRTIFELLPIGVSILDAQRKISFMNSALERILKISSEGLLKGDYESRTYLRSDRTPMPAEEFASVRAMAEQRAVHDVETGVVKEDGTVIWTRVSAVPVTYPDWKTVIVTADITEHKQAEEELGESEAKYRVLFEGTKQGILVADAQTQRFTYANQSISRMLGYTTEELLRLGVADIHPQESLPHVQSEFEAQILQEKTLAVGLPCLRKDGTVFYADVNSSPILIDGRQCNVAFFTDITERKRAEEARRQAEDNFRRSMDESPLGIRIVSAKGETLYANQAVLDIYGYKDIKELRSTPLKNRYTPESYAEYRSRKKKRMNKEDCSSEYEINILRKTGEIRRLRVFRKGILWNGQKQFQTIYQDITEQKKTEEKLRETLSGLRNALGGIIQVLSAITEKRDPYTAGHQKRVADLARAIGEEMGLAAERVEGLRLAGTIHDIGKVSIPAEILSKPGSLTETEYRLIQDHPKVGHDILGDIKFSWPIAIIVLQHHERMNGSGYPAGLKGDDILLEARILAVSDVMEAMASHRPYRPALGIEAALKEIDKSKGVLFDSDVVAACLKLFREKKFILKA
jgi:PAS domain S-box-containing protein